MAVIGVQRVYRISAEFVGLKRPRDRPLAETQGSRDILITGQDKVPANASKVYS